MWLFSKSSSFRRAPLKLKKSIKDTKEKDQMVIWLVFAARRLSWNNAIYIYIYIYIFYLTNKITIKTYGINGIHLTHFDKQN